MADYSLFFGDCLHVAPNYPDNFFQLLMTSPPYPGLRGFSLSGAAYTRFLFRRLAAWLPKIDAVTGVMVLVYKWPRAAGWFDTDQLALLEKICRHFEMGLVDLYPWDKLNSPPAGAHHRYDRDQWEIVAVFARSADYLYQPVRRPYSPKTIGKAAAGNMRQVDIAGSLGNGHDRLHPSGARPANVLRISSSGDQGRPRVKGGSFPRGLARRFVLQHSRPGDWVLDPFCGAGTVLQQAIALGRLAVGVDNDPQAIRTASAWLQEIEAGG